MSRRIYWAAHNYEVIPCHLVAKKDRDGRGKYAANSRRDKRRFQVAFTDRFEAEQKAVEYANKLESKD